MQEVLSIAASSSKAAIVGNFVANIIVSGSLNMIWALIEIQQIIVMLPLFHVDMPGNARDFYAQIMAISAFDYFDTTDLVHEAFDVPPTEPVNEDFEDLGLESRYMLVNIGSLIIPWLF